MLLFHFIFHIVLFNRSISRNTAEHAILLLRLIRFCMSQTIWFLTVRRRQIMSYAVHSHTAASITVLQESYVTKNSQTTNNWKFQIETLSETRATLFWMKQMNTIEQSLYIKIDLFAKKIHSLFENSLQNQLQFVSLHENSFGVAQKEANFKYERDNYIVFRVKFQHLHFVDDFSVIQKIWRNSSDNGRWWGCNFSFFNFHAKMENAIKLDEQNQKLVFSLSVDRHTHRTITRNHMNWIARVANDLNERTKMDLHWFENDQYSRNID